MENKDIRRANLRALMSEYLSSGYNKAQFADKLGMPAAQLSQLTSDKEVRNIGDVLARKIEDSLSLPNGWMDTLQVESKNENHCNDRYILQNTSDKGTDHTYRIELLDLEYSCGGGSLNHDYPDVVRAVELEPEHAKRMFGGRKASSLGIVTAVGDSMLGTIDPGSLVVIDKTVNRFISDGIYAFTFMDASHIKRLQLLGDKMIVISDNSVYQKWEINESNESQFRIEGFVVGKWEMNYTRLG
ncbi:MULTISPECIES: S24 family peptidase [unclassified Providencia]|uniref:S24 family peptidase n=1 Tax=unclassified Providencia TaxID=2633465 RepID=UPI00234AB02C|nr:MULTISPECIES: S24 family peptidase [unclassified Providencia]